MISFKFYKTVTANASLLLLALLALPHYGITRGNTENVVRSASQVSQEEITVRGIVRDENGGVMPGVNVVVKGSSNGTSTDANGLYTINAPEDAVLIFSFIGYNTQEIAINNRSNIDLTLAPDTRMLNEVVVLGYGTVEKKDLIGSVGIANAKDFGNVAVSSAQQLIQGKIAGVQVINSGGLPGSDVKITVRGTGTFTNADPLYVIDGIQGNPEQFNAISPYDIESVTVLKDASSTAIYGANAANGVVIVTTKKAKAGTTKVTYNGYYGVAQPSKKLDMMNATQYLDLVKDITNNNLTSKLQSPDVLVDRTDWQDAIFRTAKITEHNIGISGGTEKVLFNASTTYTDQDGIMEAYNFKRLNFRLGLEEKLGKRFEFGQTINFRYTVKSGNTADFIQALRMPTYSPIYDPTNLGGFAKVTSVDDLNDTFNPLTAVNLTERRDRDFQTFGQFYGQVEILKGLRFRSQVSLQFDNNTGYNYTRAYINGNLTIPNGTDEYYGNGINPLLENYFSYTKQFGVHRIDATLGNTYRKGAMGRSVRLSGSNFPNDDLKNVIAAPTSRISGGYVSQSSLLSYFARVNYTLMDKYLLTASVRRDGSYVFSRDNRFGNFPSVGLGWKISEEDFMKTISSVSQLKLRASYGKSGNSNIPMLVPSVWKGEGNNIVYSLGNGKTYAQGATVNSAVNPNNQWETTKQFDIGLDLGLFEDRLTFEFGYYDRKNEGLLTYVPLPLSTGIGGPYDIVGNILKNTATASNKGFEASIGYQGSGGSFRYSINFNTAYNVNKVIDLGEGSAFQRGSVAGSYLATKTDEGQPIGSFFGYVVDHVAIDQADVDAYNQRSKDVTGLPGAVYEADLLPGDIIFRDLDGDGQLTSKDQTFIGSPIPKWNYGGNINLGFKQFDLMVSLYGIGGVQVWNDLKYHTEGTTRPFNASADLLSRWRTEGDVSEYPKAGQHATGSQNLRPSDRFVENGSYLRFRNVTLGYSVPVATLGSVGKTFSSLRVYATAQNLLTVTKYKGYDPEIGGQDTSAESFLFARGIDGGQYPQPRSFMLGVQVGF
jgi:TonB-linked SusC/RagA family outer membrane protein